MNILVLNGPNLNMLGKREKEHYGGVSLEEIEKQLRKNFPEHKFEIFQSNHEGELIERIHKSTGDTTEAIICNFAGYTHTSVAILDAMKLFHGPKMEAHLSNIHAREEFRHHSVTAAACDGVIAGLGVQSYLLAAEAVIRIAAER